MIIDEISNQHLQTNEIIIWQKQFANKYLGGSTYDDILEFDPLTGQWKEVDGMIQGRSSHSVAVIDFDSGLCVV